MILSILLRCVYVSEWECKNLRLIIHHYFIITKELWWCITWTWIWTCRWWEGGDGGVNVQPRSRVLRVSFTTSIIHCHLHTYHMQYVILFIHVVSQMCSMLVLSLHGCITNSSKSMFCNFLIGLFPICVILYQSHLLWYAWLNHILESPRFCCFGTCFGSL